MDKKMLGIVTLTLGIIFLVGALFEISIYRENAKQHKENEQYPSFEGSDQDKEEEEGLEVQFMAASFCCGLFVILFIIGAILMVKSPRKSQIPPQYPPYQPPPQYPPYQQPPQYPPQQPSQYQPPPPYPPPPPYTPQQPPYQPPQYPSPYPPQQPSEESQEKTSEKVKESDEAQWDQDESEDTKLTCPECGGSVERHWKVCPYCETRLKED